MEFSIENFDASPTVEELLTLRKADLLLVVEYYKVPAVKSTMRKSDILTQVIRWFVDEEIFAPHALSKVPANRPTDDNPSEQVRLRELEMEKSRLDLERERVVLERVHAQGRRRDGVDFDVTKHVRLVPDFDDTDVDRYFLHFEQVALNMDWPRNKWASLLQTKLKGKACDAYAALSVEEARNYDTVKNVVMQAYSLVPEAYRQKFRNMRKHESQSYREFAKSKQMTFDRWLQSIEATSLEKVKEAILIEEFKRSVPADLRAYLEEKKCSTLTDAATKADEYFLTRVNRYVNAGRSSSFRNQMNTPNTDSKPSQGGDGSDANNQTTTGNQTSQLVCYYCKQAGHVRSECPKLQKKKSAEKDTEIKPFPNGLVANPVKSNCGCEHAHAPENDVRKHVSVPHVMKSADSDQIKSQFAPFTSVGYVSLVGCDEARKVSILRDTGASQSLIVDSVLPFGGQSSTGTSVVLQGMEGGYMEVPLHTVDLQSGLVSGRVNLGIRKSLPMEGVSLILGNDLAGAKVTVPVVSAAPLANEQVETAELVQEFPEVFPACVVTRSMAKKSSESVRKTSPDDVSLEDSFFCRLKDENTCTKETDTCTQSKENDTNTNTCTHEDKQTHDMSDEAQNVDESELLLNKSSLIEAQKDCAFVALNESALSEDETQTQFESKERSFDPGEVLILLPIPGDPLRARGSGPCVVEEKVSDMDYVIRTPDRQGQKRLCRVNVSKTFVEINPSEGATPVFGVVDNEVEAVQSFPPAATKKELMRFLKMAGFYRRFCHNFLDVVAPSTDLWKNAMWWRP